MGREIKRVPMNFDWPINKIWDGYLVSEYQGDLSVRGCPECPIREADCDEDNEICIYHPSNYDKWHHDPSSGNGYQLWETTSEGSPISPVFETPEGLAKWLADTDASSFGPQTATYDKWLRFIRSEEMGICPGRPELHTTCQWETLASALTGLEPEVLVEMMDK